MRTILEGSRDSLHLWAEKLPDGSVLIGAREPSAMGPKQIVDRYLLSIGLDAVEKLTTMLRQGKQGHSMLGAPPG